MTRVMAKYVEAEVRRGEKTMVIAGDATITVKEGEGENAKNVKKPHPDAGKTIPNPKAGELVGSPLQSKINAFTNGKPILEVLDVVVGPPVSRV